MAKPDVKSMLEKLREKMDSIQVGGGSGYLQLDEGRTTVRILPPVGQMEFFFQVVGKHFGLPDNGSEFCPTFTTGDEEVPCPICDLIKELYRTKDPDDKELAKKLGLRKQFWMNVVVRDPKDREGIDASDPIIWQAGAMVFQKLKALVGDPDYGDISDPGEEGRDVTIDRTGKGMETKYEVVPRGKSSPLHPDDEVVEKWLETAEDLSYVILTDDPDQDKELSTGYRVVLLPYDRIAVKYGLDTGKVPAKLYEALNEDAGKDERPARRPERTVREKDDEVGEEIRRSRLARRGR